VPPDEISWTDAQKQKRAVSEYLCPSSNALRQS